MKRFGVQPNKKSNSVYIFSPFFEENAGYHWRAVKWKEILQQHGFQTTIGSAISKDEFYSLYPKQSIKFQRIFLKRRFQQVLDSRKFETVIVRREMLLYNDYGNLFLEKLLLHFHPEAILDFDDDIAAAKNQPKAIKNRFGKIMRENGNKFNESLQLFRNFIPATSFLKSRLKSQNLNVKETDICVIPTCIDYNKHAPKIYDNGKPIITFGWIGNSGNYFLLDEILPELEKLSGEFNFELLVVGGKEYTREVSFPIRFKKWSLQTEIKDLKEIDLGLMPLKNDKVSEGKAGFKLIQYMALGIVSLASNVTVNKEIIPNKQTGFLVQNNWFDILKQAFDSKDNWPKIGENARKHVLRKYSYEANQESYLKFIQHVQLKSKIT